MDELTRTWRPDWPVPVGQVWSTWRRGQGDPTYRVDTAGCHWRGLLTPCGPATLRVRERPAQGVVEASSWGEGASWALDALPAMLGADDDPAGFEPAHPVLARAAHAHPHWRVGRGGCVWAALLPAVLEQKVTGQEAFDGYRRLVHRFGTPAPGPVDHVGLRVPPAPEQVRRVPSWAWLQAGVDHARSSTVLRAAAVASGLERTLSVDHAEADRRLRSVPGLGPWTSAEVRQRAHGDPDAVSLGDFHVARNISWALVGEQRADAETAELLEPYRGHRYRVQRLLELAGLRHPRHGQRMAPRRHLPTGRA